ncbi:MAG: hypothetical protein RLZZ393_1531 [Pseudomonadota bacterium]
MAANPRYQWLLIALLSFNFGIVFFDRNAISFLTPFIQQELQLSNTQIGLFASALAFSWALAGLFIGWLSDKLGKRKILLVVSTIVFSLASVLSGLAGGFLSLLGARLLMGVAEGGIMPVSQTLIAAEVAPERRGLAQGITQIFGANLLANFLGPIVIVAIGASMGWRNAFFVSALPGFFSAVLLWMLVREPEVAVAASEAPRGRSALLPLLADRTLLLCILIATLLVAFFVVFMTFMPLYLTQVRGVTNQGMSYIMSTFGLASMAVAFLVPGSSDRFGRKPVVVVTFLVGLILPLGVLLTSGSDPLPLVVSIALGCCVSGCFPLVMATIPSEHVAAAQTATALSLTMGISEVVGGVAAPYFAGGIADAYGLGAVMWILAGICLSCALLALMLKETAPRVLALRRAVP